MTDQELKDIVAAVVAELEKSGVDFDYKIETPLDTDNVFVIRGTAPNYQGAVVTWKGLLDIITAQATQAKNDAETAKNAANAILTQITTKESNVSTMKSEVSEMKASVETTKSQVEGMKNAVETTKGQVETMKTSIETTKEEVETMKTSVETSKSQVEANKSQVETMKTSIETTKSEVETLKSESETAKETATQKAAETTQAKGDVESMKASIEKTVADFNALAEEKKLEVQGVYQTDLNELKGDLVDVIHYDSVEKIYEKLDVDFTNGTVGRLNSADTINETYTDYIVSDYIPLDGVRKIYRYGITVKYNFEAYCLYDSNKNAIDNGFHARTTNYTFEEYDGRTDVVSYDISLTGAKYIRINKDNTLTKYSYVMEKENGCIYILNNDIHAPNIDENTEKITTIDSKVAMISDERLLAKTFIKFRSDRNIVYDNTYINTENGIIYNGDAYSLYKSSDYVPIDNTKNYNTAFCSRINFYDENRNWLYGQLPYSNKTGSGRMYKIEIQDERVAYARLTYAPSNNEPYCGLAEEQDNYEILNLGDSIFGINPVCFDISSIAQEKTGYRFANCGFGGSQASSYPDETSPYYSFNFWKIADAIDSGDFSEQIASAEEIYTNGDASILYQNRIDILASVDFSKLKLITIGYGTNDFSKYVSIDNPENKKDVTTYCGALRYGIEKILAKYPHIQICLFLCNR